MFFVPIPKAIAKERGLKYYQSHKPCIEGFIAKRNVTNNLCTCDSCKKRSSMTSVKSASKRKDILNAKARERYSKNPSKKIAQNKEWAVKNKDKRKISDAIRYAKNKQHMTAVYKKWYVENKSSVSLRQRNYRANNKQKLFIKMTNRKAHIRLATLSLESELTDFVLAECYSLSKLREQCSTFKWHTDHMIPLQNSDVCGLHIWNNFQCIPSFMNISKSNKLIYTNPHEWLYDIPKFFKVVYQKEIAA